MVKIQTVEVNAKHLSPRSRHADEKHAGLVDENIDIIHRDPPRKFAISDGRAEIKESGESNDAASMATWIAASLSVYVAMALKHTRSTTPRLLDSCNMNIPAGKLLEVRFEIDIGPDRAGVYCDEA